MAQREQARRSAELAVLALVKQHNAPRAAREIALELGWPWRIVARALQRLTLAGEVLQTVLEHRGSRSRPRLTRTYRAADQCVSSLPVWLTGEVLPIYGAKLVKGRAGIDRGASLHRR